MSNRMPLLVGLMCTNT